MNPKDDLKKIDKIDKPIAWMTKKKKDMNYQYQEF